jgi:hypothetical protein
MKTFFIFTLLSLAAFAQDPLFNRQWAMKNDGQKIFRAEGEIRNQEIVGTRGVDIEWPGVEALKNLAQGKSDIIVAVIDSGIDMGHPDLKGRILPGRDFLDNQAMQDDTGHGTHVAGIIAANTDRKGIQGVAPAGVKILPIKVLSKNITGFVYKNKYVTDIIADAIGFAIESKASVINMSLGWPQLVHTARMVRALDTAAARGIVMIAASGNNNKDVPTWPCAHPAVICVGATDNQGKLTEFSNHGGKVDLVAPGEWIVSTIPRALESRTLRINGYEAKNGSSQASPFVAAAAALLRLQNPDMSVAEVKARLYQSAKPLVASNDQRFVRFGSLSIAGALSQSMKPMASAMVKEIITVDVSTEGSFTFDVPLEILGDSTEEINVAIKGIDAHVSLQGGKARIEGQLENLLVDSEIPVEISVERGDVTTTTTTTLSFARQISEQNLRTVPIKSIPANSLVMINGVRRATRVLHVSVEDRPSSDFHGYLQEKIANTENFKVTSLRANAGASEVTTREITLESLNQLVAVIEKDINLDGTNDLIFYGLDATRTKAVLVFKTLEGKDLFGPHTRWEMPLTTFEGLPLREGLADFSWIKIKTFLGDIAVPYYQKAWLLPKEDNVQDLLDFEPAGAANRFYYWEPILENSKVVARPRVVNSVTFNQTLRQRMQATSWEMVSIERILPQTSAERAQGVVRHIVSAGEAFFRRFAILTVRTPGDYTLVPHTDTDVFQIGNNPIMSRSVEDYSVTKSSFQMALLDRSSARVKPFVEGEAHSAWTLETSGWNNPFFEVVASFEGNNERTLFFESRYHVYAYTQNGSSKPRGQRLPINRDSSFPGENFSETLQSALVRAGNHNLPAVVVNSTLIYGDRLYTMVSLPEGFVRPVELSVKIPANCTPLRSQRLVTEGLSAYTLICRDQAGVASIGFFPLEIH